LFGTALGVLTEYLSCAIGLILKPVSSHRAGNLIFCLVEGLPFFLFWRSYKKALLSFASVHDEVLSSGKSAGRRPWNVIAVLTVMGALILLGAVFNLVQVK
jgi:hypothetical protein